MFKNQQLNNFFHQIFQENDPELWEYFSSVLLKHTMLNSSDEEKKQLTKFIENENVEAVQELIVEKISVIWAQVQKEIHEFIKSI